MIELASSCIIQYIHSECTIQDMHEQRKINYPTSMYYKQQKDQVYSHAFLESTHSCSRPIFLFLQIGNGI